MSQRLIFSAVALAPALAALAVPGFVQGPVLGMIGPFGVSSLAIFLAFVAVHATRRTRDKEEQPGIRDEGTLLTAAAHHTPPIDIPDTEELRARVAARLVRRHCPDNKPFGPAEPDSMDFALSRIVGQVVDLWEADSAEAALSLLEDRKLKVDVVVTDVVMPGMDGPTWVAKALEDRPGVKVVFVSGYAEESVSEHQKRIPNSVFLPKPFSLQDLVATVRNQTG